MGNVVVVGVETDEDGVIFHGSRAETMNLAEFSPEDDQESALRLRVSHRLEQIYPDMHQAALADLVPLALGNIRHIAEVRRTAPVWWCEQQIGKGGFNDGGYWVLGLRAADPEALLGVPMSLAHTGAAQLDRLRGLGLHTRAVPELTDLDTFDEALEVAAVADGRRFPSAVASVQASLGRSATPAT